jgi:signal transduction histidine kinase
VEAVGFPALVAAHLEVQAALLRQIPGGGTPEVSVVTARRIVEDAGRVERDAQLIRLPGKLREIERRSGYHVLLMAADGLRFEALLPAAVTLPSRLRPGSDLELTGVCQMISTEGARQLGKWPDAFEVLLPSAASIRVVGAPPWWTFERLASALGGVAAMLALALLWALTLRRKVEQRTSLLAKEIRARHDSELLATERQRLAADLHDTLSQTLTGAAFQLEVAESLAPPASPAAAEHLALAQRLVDRSRDELRLAVWDLTPGALIAQGLLPALENVGCELADGTGCAISVNAEGSVAAIPEGLGVHLFRIAQEAITNAVRHGRASRIGVHLDVGEEAVSLSVHDDGCGFDPKAAPGPQEGHFGLRSLQERVRRLGGTVAIQSTSAGTTISARVPPERHPAVAPS